MRRSGVQVPLSAPYLHNQFAYFMPKDSLSVAVVGCTGNVGSVVIELLEHAPIGKLYPVASQRSIGRTVSFKNQELDVLDIDLVDFSEIDFVFGCAGSDISKSVRNKMSTGVLIDKSSFFRMQKDVPLVVPEVNGHITTTHKGVISSPNCVVIPVAIALDAARSVGKVKRVVISTYQAVSDAGSAAMDELYQQTKNKFTCQELKRSVFERDIAFNVIPFIGKPDNLASSEENEVSSELKKILGDDEMGISVTCVRVPVFVGHSAAINIQFEDEVDFIELQDVYSSSSIIKYSDQYVTPADMLDAEKDLVYISRLRSDSSAPYAFNLWLCCDNLRKGAALNAVQIFDLVNGL